MDIENSTEDGGAVFALGNRGVFVPDGMTAEMVMAGAAALEEMEFPTTGYVSHYHARDIARRVWEAMSAAAKVPSRATPLSGSRAPQPRP